jgi:hypothetical protein
MNGDVKEKKKKKRETLYYNLFELTPTKTDWSKQQKKRKKNHEWENICTLHFYCVCLSKQNYELSVYHGSPIELSCQRLCILWLAGWRLIHKM